MPLHPNLMSTSSIHTYMQWLHAWVCYYGVGSVMMGWKIPRFFIQTCSISVFPTYFNHLTTVTIHNIITLKHSIQYSRWIMSHLDAVWQGSKVKYSKIAIRYSILNNWNGEQMAEWGVRGTECWITDWLQLKLVTVPRLSTTCSNQYQSTFFT